jgi:hypothetical protein
MVKPYYVITHVSYHTIGTLKQCKQYIKQMLKEYPRHAKFLIVQEVEE